MAVFRARVDMLVGPPIAPAGTTRFVRADDVVPIGGDEQAVPVGDGGWVVGEGEQAVGVPAAHWELVKPPRAVARDKE